MLNIHSKALVALVVLVAAPTLFAAPFNSFDPRSMAMGGAGVALPNISTAPYFNPALLSIIGEEEDFSMELPVIGGRVYDPDDFIDSIDDFMDRDFDTILQNSVDAANNVNLITGATSSLVSVLDGLSTDADDLDGGLKTIGSKPLQGEGGLAVVLGVPSREYGAAFSASLHGAIAGIVNYRDSALLQAVNSDVKTYNECLTGQPPGQSLAISAAICFDSTKNDQNTVLINLNNVTIQNPLTSAPFSVDKDVQSDAQILGMITQEYALSLSREFILGGLDVAVGITPKLVKTKVFHYQANANNFDTDFDYKDYTKDYSDFNFDLGVAKEYPNGWYSGMVIKNVISHSYETAAVAGQTREVEVKPQARLGVALVEEDYSLAADLDLTENDPIGTEEKSRYLALGAEYHPASWVQLRAGYRVHANNSDRNIPSVGIGLAPWGVHIDLAMAINSSEIGGSLQLGFRF